MKINVYRFATKILTKDKEAIVPSAAIIRARSV